MPWMSVDRPSWWDAVMAGNYSGTRSTNAAGGGTGPASTTVAAKTQKMTITPLGASEGLTVPYAPREVTATNLSDTWAEVSRFGKTPLVVKEAVTNDHLAFSLLLAHRDMDQPVTGMIQKLRNYAKMQTPLLLSYSTLEEGLWHIMSLSITTYHRRHDHEVTRAGAEVEFVRSNTAYSGVGPVSGGVGSGGAAGGGGGGGGAGSRIIFYPLKKDQSLHDLAILFFKDAEKWRDIAKWNDVKDPRPGKELKVGRLMEIRNPVRNANLGVRW